MCLFGAGSLPDPHCYLGFLENAARIWFAAGSLPHPHCHLGLLENAACACLVLALFLTIVVI